MFHLFGVTKGGTQKLYKNIMIIETDMTIHRKALDSHFLMVPLVSRFGLSQRGGESVD
jgi:hypothetical protein